MSSRKFQEVLTVFQAELGRRKRERVDDHARALQRLARDPSYQRSGTPYVLRNELHQKFVEGLGQDFMNALESVIIQNCAKISIRDIETLKHEMRSLFNGYFEHAKSGEKSVTASLGYRGLLESVLAPLGSIYNLAMAKYLERLEARIAAANLQKATQRTQARREKLGDLGWKLVTYALTFLLGVALGWLL